MFFDISYMMMDGQRASLGTTHEQLGDGVRRADLVSHLLHGHLFNIFPVDTDDLVTDV